MQGFHECIEYLLQDLRGSPLPGFHGTTVNVRRFCLHSMMCSYIGEIMEVEESLAEKWGILTNIPCFRCSSEKNHFGLRSSGEKRILQKSMSFGVIN